jgi:hypothetical protein
MEKFLSSPANRIKLVKALGRFSVFGGLLVTVLLLSVTLLSHY